MPVAEFPFQLDIDAIRLRLGAQGIVLPNTLVFGLGAGIYFEYYRRPGDSPSRFFTGHNRQLEQELDSRVAEFLNGDRREAIVSALRTNALAMNIDRSPVAGVMGMELFAEELENWATLPDWEACAREAARTIEDTGSLYRRRYVQFLREASECFDPVRRLLVPLREIAGEWDILAAKLRMVAIPDPEEGFTHAGRLLQRLAAREEHFWGELIELTNL